MFLEVPVVATDVVGSRDVVDDDVTGVLVQPERPEELAEGMLKLIFRRDTRAILGVHMIGVAASELIHIGMMLLHTGATLDHVVAAVFNYPTLSESYRIAALDGLNRL